MPAQGRVGQDHQWKGRSAVYVPLGPRAAVLASIADSFLERKARSQADGWIDGSVNHFFRSRDPLAGYRRRCVPFLAVDRSFAVEVTRYLLALLSEPNVVLALAGPGFLPGRR